MFKIKIAIVVLTNLIVNESFSQVNSIVDSVFRLENNSIEKNNYYLVKSTKREFSELMDRNYEENKILWTKRTLEVLWQLPSKTYGEVTDASWENYDWENINLDPNDTLICERNNNIPNGSWYFKRPWLKVTGEFANGLANGTWDKIETGKREGINTSTHVHQEFSYGIPKGEWYEETNGERIYTHFFIDGKSDGVWIDYVKVNGKRYKMETFYRMGIKNGKQEFSKDNVIASSFNYLDGKIDGKFKTNLSFIFGQGLKTESLINGEFNSGILVNLEIFTLDLISKKSILSKKIENSDVIKCSEYYSNGKLKILIESEPNTELKINLKAVIGKPQLSNDILMCNREDNIPCVFKKTIYDEQGKVQSTEFITANTYLIKERIQR